MNVLFQPIVLRLLIYIISPLLGLIPAAFAGAVTYDAVHQVLSISLPGLAYGAVSAVVVTGSVFAKWGVK